MYLKYDCDISKIELEGFGEIERNWAANIIIICDMLIIGWFIVHTALQYIWIKRETQTSQAQHVDMTDFSV